MSSKFNKERRDVLKSGCVLAGAAAFVSVGGSGKAFAQSAQSKGVPKLGDAFVHAEGPNKGKDVIAADVVLGARPVTAIAKDPGTGALIAKDGDSSNATVLFFRVSSDALTDDTKDAAADNGVLCYSAVCTHLGCMLTDWDAEKKWFQCPCHDATFDPVKGGENTGGATCRTLPILPIKSVDGKLVVADKFIGYVGVKRG